MISIDKFGDDPFNDPNSILFEGHVQLPQDEGEPDPAKTSREYPPKMRTGHTLHEFVPRPDPHDHQPMPNWVIAFATIGLLGLIFGIGAMFAK